MFFGKLIQYIFLVFVGFLLILLVSIILETPAGPQGEYHYSKFLRNNYGITAGILFCIALFWILVEGLGSLANGSH